MRTKARLVLGIFSFAAAGLLVWSIAKPTFAYQGDPVKRGPNCNPERHEAMIKAFEDNDYEAWKKQMQGRGRVVQVINKDNFAKFAQAHKLAEEGKFAEAQAIRAEFGLGLRNGQGWGQGRVSRWNR